MAADPESQALTKVSALAIVRIIPTGTLFGYLARNACVLFPPVARSNRAGSPIRFMAAA